MVFPVHLRIQVGYQDLVGLGPQFTGCVTKHLFETAIGEVNGPVVIDNQDAIVGVLQKRAVVFFGVVQLIGSVLPCRQVFNGQEGRVGPRSGQACRRCKQDHGPVSNSGEIALNIQITERGSRTQNVLQLSS